SVGKDFERSIPENALAFLRLILEQSEDEVMLAHTVGAIDLVRIGDLDELGDWFGLEVGQVHGGWRRRTEGGWYRQPIATVQGVWRREIRPAPMTATRGGNPSAEPSSSKARRVAGSKMAVNKRGKLGLGQCPDLLRRDLTTLEKNQGRYATDAIFCGRAGIRIDVELGDRKPAGVVLGHLIKDGSNHFARPTPFRPIVDQNRCARLQH